MTTFLQDLRYRLRLRAQAWHRSPEYAVALEARDEALSRNLIFAEGFIPRSDITMAKHSLCKCKLKSKLK
jgi:Domain of unknown function (DUF1330)